MFALVRIRGPVDHHTAQPADRGIGVRAQQRPASGTVRNKHGGHAHALQETARMPCNRRRAGANVGAEVAHPINVARAHSFGSTGAHAIGAVGAHLIGATHAHATYAARAYLIHATQVQSIASLGQQQPSKKLNK